MYCKNCGAPMDDSYNVCQECGTQKGVGNAFCPNCGTIHNMNTAFCENCGYHFEEAQQQMTQQNNPSVPYSQQTPYQQFSSMSQQPNSQYMPPEKYCKNCGTKLMSSQVVCTSCGTKVGQGVSFCQHCGSPVAPGSEACMSCGRSLKPTINIGEQASGFVKNFNNIFNFQNYTPKDMVFQWGPYLLSAVIFIISLLPCIYVEVFGYRESMNVFSISGFCGFLFLLAFLVSVARLVPAVDEFLQSNQLFGQYASMVPPALEIVATVIMIIACSRASRASIYGTAGFTFGGWLLAILTLGSAAIAVLDYLKKQGKINF